MRILTDVGAVVHGATPLENGHCEVSSMSDEVIEAPSPAPHSAAPTRSLRWEWRTFGRRFGDAERRIAKLNPTGVQESDEIYFISAAGDNVKIRDRLMDVKILREVDADGLEQWAPVLKAKFPLSADDAWAVVQALRVPVYGLRQDSYTFDDVVEKLSDPALGVRMVKVHKRRVRYTIEGCIAECSDVTANGLPTRTIAVESEDSSAVLRAVEILGLSGYTNTSYPRGLADLIDAAPERYAVIDVGTNSIKFHIGQRGSEGVWTTIADRAEITRLGEGLAESGRISEPALNRTVEAISGMAADAKRAGVRAIAAVGTAGLRQARNSAEVIASIHDRSGIEVEVVSGDEEARLAYLATKRALPRSVGTIVVFDTGGGSSQFTFGNGDRVDERFSIDVGAARYTELFGLDRAVSKDVLEQALIAIGADLGRLDDHPAPDAIVGMGGAITNITAVALRLSEYDPDQVQGATVTAEEMDRQIELYGCRDADARRTIVGLQSKRAEVILAGACIVRTVLQKFGKKSLIVSDRGLRHGVLAERFGPVSKE
jgi:exopolyphosphatase / guanosine-5'-triphosphate,3'-diphosphate pyrophosphatase